MSKLKKLDEWVCNNNIISAELCRIQDNIEREFIGLETELAELRERCADYENEIVYALRYLDSLRMTYDKHESEPEYQIKVSFERVLAKYKGGYNER